MAYEKFDPDKSVLKAIAIKYNGNVKAIAKELNVNKDTVYQYFKRDPAGEEIIKHVRGYNSFTDSDLAEHVNRYNMSNYEKRPGIAQRAAEFVLLHQAKDRGYVREDNKDISFQDANIDNTIREAKEKAALRAEIKRLKELYEPETGTEHLRSEQEAEYLVRSSQVGKDS